MSSDYKGLLLVVSSPSGAGKTTLCRRLRDEFAQIQFSVSYTTRSPRPGEVHGREYFFVDRDAFTAMVARDEFAEYALVHGNNYGTSASLVREALASGTDLLFDIDFQGGRQLRRCFPADVVLVFILPPSLGELQRRLQARNTDAPEVIERRLRVARDELSHYAEYDYVIVNDDLNRAYAALRAIYIAESHRCARQRSAAEAVLSGQQVLGIARGAIGDDKEGL
ncbi:guanylate kinase [Nannocystis exedens]|uniref:Guanylate kinase n=1 Tax=Nannocystis exedens TaxID=54 RepID=A0A1I1SHS2_9BACT|nr:guanylate kinase [Nannocystis exedens]SFD46027.1 guanylate kinase [Nannocystis exedens]